MKVYPKQYKINMDFEQELYKHFGQVKDFTLGMQIAKHFYELGKQSKQPVCEGDEEEYEQIKQKVCSDCPSHKDDDCGYVTRKLQRKCNYLSDVMYGYELGRQSKEQPLLPGFENEQPGIPGKDFVPVAWCDALEQYGIWRIERVEQPVCEELEEAADAFAKTYDMGSCDGIAQDCFIAGAKWQKEQMMDEWLKDRDGCFWDGVEEGKKAMREQMMKEAVEGEFWNTPFPTICLGVCKNYKFKDNQKVRIIICKKED